jgi:lambda family phage minor tail protein L
MHEVDATEVGGDVYRFHDGLGQGVRELLWCGRKYTYWPVEIDELRIEGDRPSRPRLRLGNPGGLVTKLCNDYQDLVGAVYTLRTTKGMFLDSANFSGWKGYAVALEGSSALVADLPTACSSYFLELEAPSDPEPGKDARALRVAGAVQYAVGFQDGGLYISAGGERRALSSAVPGDKFTLAIRIVDRGGKVTITGLVNEAAFTWETQAGYSLPSAVTLGGVENQGVRIRTLIARQEQFTVQDIRSYVESGLVSNPVAHYRFNEGTLKEALTDVLMEKVNHKAELQEEYFYALYGISKHTVRRMDFLGSIYLVDWVKTNPTASIYEEFPAEKFRIVRKASETPMEVSFEMAPLHDVKGIKLPLRIVTENVCLHDYRDEFCRYSGPPRRIDGQEIVVPPNATDKERQALLALDECSHDKQGCMARHGRVLPIGSFLGAGRVRR